jgi:TonB family protein
MRPFNLFCLALFNLGIITSSPAQYYNKALIAQLDSIAQFDQQYRSVAKQEAAKNRQEDAENMRRQEIIDRLNLARVERIFAQYGYPGKSLVGEKHQATAFLVIQHSDDEVQEKYLPLLTEAANKGELRASSLAILIDRVRGNRGEKQLYGSQLRETKQGVKLMPIDDEPNVNVRRAKIGLQPLEVYLTHWNITYKVPTAAYQNPADLYYIPEPRSESPVEVVGGWEALNKQVFCPARAREKAISGAVTVELTVDKQGLPKDITVVKSLGYGCDEEAVRVIKAARFTNTSGEDHEMRIRLPFSCTR